MVRYSISMDTVRGSMVMEMIWRLKTSGPSIKLSILMGNSTH